MFPSLATPENMTRNNVSATMFPSLARALGNPISLFLDITLSLQFSKRSLRKTLAGVFLEIFSSTIVNTYNRDNFESEIKFGMLKKCQIQKNESSRGPGNYTFWSRLAPNVAVRPLFKISGFGKGTKISIHREEHEILSGRNLANDKIEKFCLI